MTSLRGWSYTSVRDELAEQIGDHPGPRAPVDRVAATQTNWVESTLISGWDALHRFGQVEVGHRLGEPARWVSTLSGPMYRRAVKNRPVHELVSENLHRLTEEKGMALAVVADRAGLDRREFFAVLAGEQEGDLDWLNKVAEAIGVDTAELVIDLHPRPKTQV